MHFSTIAGVVSTLGNWNIVLFFFILSPGKLRVVTLLQHLVDDVPPDLLLHFGNVHLVPAVRVADGHALVGADLQKR